MHICTNIRTHVPNTFTSKHARTHACTHVAYERELVPGFLSLMSTDNCGVSQTTPLQAWNA